MNCERCARFGRNPANPATDEEHSCPYDEDVNDDPEPKCTCCSDCAAECAADI